VLQHSRHAQRLRLTAGLRKRLDLRGHPVAPVGAQGQYGGAMEISELPSTPVVLPATGRLVHIRTQKWALERWEGDDPPGLAVPWARKPKFSVDGSRSCAELAIVQHLRAGGWGGVWVNAFRGELRTQWFPASAARRLAEVGAPGWAVEIFDRLRAANGGTLNGFFDVFAWREPGQAAFVEAKVGPDRIKPTQLRFAEIALRFRSLDDFMTVEIAGPFPQRAPASQLGTTAGQAAARRPVIIRPCSGGQDPQHLLYCPAPGGSGHDAPPEHRSRRKARWTADDVITAVASSGDDAAAIVRTVTDWAAGPYLRLAGGTGPSYPSLTIEADSARTEGSCWRGVLALYASPHGGPPALEVRVRAMCRTPPYNHQKYRSRLTEGLHALGIPRLDREADLSGLRPEIPLSELTAVRLDRLLALISGWITDVRAHAAEPETTTEQ
jgi:hypothetical protein